VGDLAVDTNIEPSGEGRWRASLCPDWEIWGPLGGYVGAIVMRAVGAEAGLPRPASFFCHYLRPTRFDEIELEVRAIRRGRTAESWRVRVTQADREVMDATVCVVDVGEGLEHEVTSCPEVPPPDQLESLAEYVEQGVLPPPITPFWDCFDVRPVDRRREWPPPGPEDPVWREWLRFVPTSNFDDPWLDAARYVLLCDLPLWPSTVPQHAWKWGDQPSEWTAPTLDLYVAFHRRVPEEPWLLLDGYAPIAADGLLGWSGRLWSTAGQLVASSTGQGLFRRLSGYATR
jgi:acyl-CoA thioesterase-2